MKKAGLGRRGRAWVAAALWGGLSIAYAQTSPVITCGGDSNASLLNTGVSVTGEIDNRWRYQGLAAYAGADPVNWSTTFGDAWVTSSNQWTAAPADGTWRWIAANSWGGQPVIPGNPNAYGNIDALFRIDFTLDPSVPPADFAPTMRFLADNSVVDIMVNGVWQGPGRTGGAIWSQLPQAGAANQFNFDGFSREWRAVTIPMATPDWQAGANSVVVYVKSSRPLMGFGAFLASNNVCPNNQAPTAAPTLNGTASVGSVVSGTYAYGDANSDVEDASATGSTFRLVRSSDAAWTPASPATVLASGAAGGGGLNHALYTLQSSDVGEYLYYCVTPAAQTGTSPGVEACTMAFGPVTDAPPNQAPTATPTLSGATSVGSVVTGSYAYGDANSDVEDASGSGSTFRLVRSSDAAWTPASPATVLASGAAGGGGVNHVLYTLQTADVGQYLYYCVTPAAQTGTSPGVEACTAALGPVTNQTPAAVPTLSTWALMLLGALLGAGAVRRRRA